MWKQTRSLKSNKLIPAAQTGRWYECIVQYTLISFVLSCSISYGHSVEHSVGQLTLTNPDTGLLSSCSATLVAPDRVATLASCLLSEETSRQASSVRVCFTVDSQQTCYQSREILSHSNYLFSNSVNDANNLAYVILAKPVSGIKPIQELTPKAFERLLVSGLSGAKTRLAGFNRSAIRRHTTESKTELNVQGLEYDYINRRIMLETADFIIADNYQGTAVILEQNDSRYLLGMISSTNPDDIVRYYPEENPCDEDPITVWYVDKRKSKSKSEYPIMRSVMNITAYPIAACGMDGFQVERGFSELKCVRMMRKIALESALEQQNPIAMRQQAVSLSLADDTTDYVIDIYKLLNSAIGSGDTRALVTMAQLLLDGDVFPRDAQSAEKLLNQVESPDADWLLAKELLKAYSEYDMRSINDELDQRVMQHLKSAAEAGIAHAQYFYGRMHQFGIGVDENLSMAYHWYAHAAMQGEPRAQFQIGSMWVDGRSKRAFPHVGYYWIRQAAARGYIRAQNYLALNQQSIDDALDELEFEYSDT